MAAQKTLTLITKMLICQNWLRLTWTYFHQCPKLFWDCAKPLTYLVKLSLAH